MGQPTLLRQTACTILGSGYPDYGEPSQGGGDKRCHERRSGKVQGVITKVVPSMSEADIMAVL